MANGKSDVLKGKSFAFIFALGGGVAWSADDPETIYKGRAKESEQATVLAFMARAKAGWHKQIEAGIIVCTEAPDAV